MPPIPKQNFFSASLIRPARLLWKQACPEPTGQKAYNLIEANANDPNQKWKLLKALMGKVIKGEWRDQTIPKEAFDNLPQEHQAEIKRIFAKWIGQRECVETSSGEKKEKTGRKIGGKT